MTIFFDRILVLLKLSPDYSYITLSDISITWLREQQVKGLILDLDNTIISEDDRYLSPQVESWLSQVKDFGIQIYLVSNGKREVRFLFWKEHLYIPGIHRARKPFRSGFQRALRSMNLRPNEVMVIGDSFHTDVLGAKISHLRCIQVASLPHPKRWWEKLIGAYIQKPYPQNYPLDQNKIQEQVSH
jgi:uncharacterized protein